MRNIILIITMLLTSLVGYGQNKELGKLSISKINKEVKIINNSLRLVDKITETKEDSVFGLVVSFYDVYAKDGVVDKISINHTSEGTKSLMTEEIYIKNNQVIYYTGIDFTTGNHIEVFYVDYVKIAIKVNNKKVEPELEVELLLYNHISSYIEFLQNKYK